MSFLDDFAAAKADPAAAAQLKSYLGPFVHAALLAQLSTRAARAAAVPVLNAARQMLLPQATAADWSRTALTAARTHGVRLALSPANTVEEADESPAGTEARRLLSLLRPMSAAARELALLRLVEGIGAAEVSEVFGEAADALQPRMLAAVREALALLSPTETVDGPYLCEPRTSAPIASVVAVENKLELLRFNEDLPVESPGAPRPLVPVENDRIGTQVVHGKDVDVTPVALQPSSAVPLRQEQIVTGAWPKLPEGPRLDAATVVRPAVPTDAATVVRPRTETSSTLVLPRVPDRKPARFPSLRAAALLTVLSAAMWLGGIRVTQKDVRSIRPMTVVMVATRDLPAGSQLDRASLAERLVPDLLASVSVVKPDAIQMALTKPLLFPMQAGDPLLWSHFSQLYDDERISNLLQRKLRAYAIPVTRLTSFDGLLRPGDRVDVLAFLKPQSSREPVVTAMLEDVAVIAVGLESEKTALFPRGRRPEYRDISLAVVSEEAELLALGVEHSAVRLTLRNPQDAMQVEDRRPSSFRSLLDEARTLRLHKQRVTTINAIRQSSPPSR